ncbi:MAG TPA: RIP metalloprotease RseP [Dehalococcoidia bacterium]|nr:RIP metalloprotease RseP [Dehalococcoidia bacterium]
MHIAIVIILFILTLFVVISLHELGHFIAARRAGVKVEEFGLGFPPRLFGIKRGEIVYSINAIPAGAFVKSTGEIDPSVPGSLASKGSWSRLTVYAAGPVANIFLAFILLSAFFTLPTSVVVGNGVMVHSIVEGSPAEVAGIEPGDVILEVNRQPVYKWGDIKNMVNSSKEGEEITLLLQRDGSQSETSLKPEFDPALGRRAIGVLLCWNIVDQVGEGSPADEAGIMPGDTILSINGQAIYNEKSMSAALASIAEGEGIGLALLRGQEEIIKEFDSARQVTGIKLGWVDGARIEQKRLSTWKAAYLGGWYITHMPELIVASIPLIKEDPGKALVGPIGAAQLTVEAVKSFGFSNMLFMAGIISLGIGLFNFFPIPPLDGGGMLVALIEGVRRGKRLSPHAMRLAYSVGTTFLITLMVLITFYDILRLIKGGSFGL